MANNKFNPEQWLPKQEATSIQSTPDPTMSSHGTDIQPTYDPGIDDAIPAETSETSVSSVEENKLTGQSALLKIASEEMEDLEDLEEIDLPTFSDKFKYPIPDFFQRIAATASSVNEADMLLLGSLAAVSSCLENVSGTYGRKTVFSNLFVFVTAAAGAGKGPLAHVRALVEPIHEVLHNEYAEELEEFQCKSIIYYSLSPKDRVGIDRPKEPPIKLRILPMNSTSAAARQGLRDNDGIALMMDTEGDILADSFRSELGNYSSDFRKASQHEPITYYRKMDKDIVEIKCPRLSAILSGTPRQIMNLVVDAENGLFSRFLFLCLPTKIVWENPFAGEGELTLDERFGEFGEEFRDLYKIISAVPPIRYHIMPEQADRFNQWFAGVQLRYSASVGNDIIGSIRRLGLATFRISMIMSVFRTFMDDGCIENDIFCQDEDYSNAMTMAEALLEHIVYVFCRLPKPSIRKSSGGTMTLVKQRFWDALPKSFTTADYKSIATSQSLSVKTAEKYIGGWNHSGQIIRVTQGHYAKKK